MELIIEGHISQILPLESGVGKTGKEWKRQNFVLNTDEQYPKKMVFEVFGADRLARFNIQIGQEVLVAFDIDAREWNGRWFNSIRAYDVRQYDPSQMPTAPAAPVQPVAAPAQPAVAAQPVAADPVAMAGEDNAEELPF